MALLIVISLNYNLFTYFIEKWNLNLKDLDQENLKAEAFHLPKASSVLDRVIACIIQNWLIACW